MHTRLVDEDTPEELKFTLFGVKCTLDAKLFHTPLDRQGLAGTFSGEEFDDDKDGQLAWPEYSRYLKGMADAQKQRIAATKQHRGCIPWMRVVIIGVLTAASIAGSIFAVLSFENTNYAEIDNFEYRLEYSAPHCMDSSSGGSTATFAISSSTKGGARPAYLRLTSLDDSDSRPEMWAKQLNDAGTDILRFELGGAGADRATFVSEVHQFAVPIYLKLPPWLLRTFTLGSFRLKLGRVRIIIADGDDECTRELWRNAVAALNYIAARARGSDGERGLTAIEATKLP